MTPEEFESSLRREVDSRLSSSRDFVLNNFFSEGIFQTDILTASIGTNIGDKLVESGLAEPSSSQELNALSLALASDPGFDLLMNELTVFLQEDERLTQTFEQFGVDPRSVQEEDLRYSFSKIIENEALLVAPIRYMASVPRLRRALNLSDDFDYDSYINSVREAVNNFDDFSEVANVSRLISDSNIVFAAAIPAVAVALLATVVAVVHTGIAAVNYVGAFTVAIASLVTVVTVSGPENVENLIKNNFPEFLYKNECKNMTDKSIWIVINISNSLRRISLPSGKSSVDLGISNIHGILVGGEYNSIQYLTTQKNIFCSSGMCILGENNPNNFCINVLENNGNHYLEFLNNRSEEYKSSDIRFDENLSISNVSVYLPENFDLFSIQREIDFENRFYLSLRLASALQANE